MYRTFLCLLIALASATVAAREVKLSAANSGSCPDAASDNASARTISQAGATPARNTKGNKPSVHSDAGGVRAPNRWNSFLPGMFR